MYIFLKLWNWKNILYIICIKHIFQSNSTHGNDIEDSSRIVTCHVSSEIEKWEVLN